MMVYVDVDGSIVQETEEMEYWDPERCFISGLMVASHAGVGAL